MTANTSPNDSGLRFIRNWAHRYFSSPQVIALAVVLVFVVVIVIFTGDMVAPVIASLVIAYLLEGLVEQFERRGMSRLIAVIIVFSGFLAFLLFAMFSLLPVLTQQAVQLVEQLPRMILKGQVALLALNERFPELEKEIVDATRQIRSEAPDFWPIPGVPFTVVGVRGHHNCGVPGPHAFDGVLLYERQGEHHPLDPRFSA